MAIKTKTIFIIGFILALACLVFLIISFATDSWVVSTEKERAGFENIGLWSVCFSKYTPPPFALVDRHYDGCWWVLDKEIDELRHYLIPGWFVGTQVLCTISLIFQLIAVIVMTVNAINCFPYNKFRDKIKLGLSLTAALLHFLTGILLTVAVILFGARADNSRTWLEKPDQNYLSWSFGLCVLAAFLAYMACMCHLLEFCRLRSEGGYDGDEPRVYLTNRPPPPSNYNYAPQKFPPANDKPDAGQPGYVSRYSNQGSQSSLNARPPNTLFAVSGAGEVYINGLADFDENRQMGRNGYPPPHERRPQPYHDRSSVNNRPYNDQAGTRQTRTYSATVPRQEDEQVGDYEESKRTKQPVLPEYVPKSRNDSMRKANMDNTFDESFDSNDKKVKEDDRSRKKEHKTSEQQSKKSKTRSESEKGKKSKKDNSHSDKHSSSRRRSRKRDDKSDSSDDEHSRSRRRSKKGNSPSTKRRSSRSRDRSRSRNRSRSRDLDSSYSNSYVDSDDTSVASRSRRKSRDGKSGKTRSASEERAQKSKSRHSTSAESRSKKKQNGNYTDDLSGSEYSSRRKSRGKTDKAESDRERRTKSRDYSDTESVKSRQSRRPGEKPKGLAYSSYYEY